MGVVGVLYIDDRADKNNGEDWRWCPIRLQISFKDCGWITLSRLFIPLSQIPTNFDAIQGKSWKKPHFCNIIYKPFALLFRGLGFYMQAPHATGIR